MAERTWDVSWHAGQGWGVPQPVLPEGVEHGSAQHWEIWNKWWADWQQWEEDFKKKQAELMREKGGKGEKGKGEEGGKGTGQGEKGKGEKGEEGGKGTGQGEKGKGEKGEEAGKGSGEQVGKGGKAEKATGWGGKKGGGQPGSGAASPAASSVKGGGGFSKETQPKPYNQSQGGVHSNAFRERMRTLHYEVAPEVPFNVFQEHFAEVACKETARGCFCVVSGGGWIAICFSNQIMCP